MPLVSIIILNYNTFNLTCNCIESVIKYTTNVSYEIVLVDNNSNECNPEIFLEKFPTIKLVKSNENGGFAKGNNLGIRYASGEYILLLNSDTYLIEDSISKIFSYIKNKPVEGLFGCKMIYPNGKLQFTARKFRSIQWELLDLFRFIPFILPYQTRAKLMLGKYFKCDFDIQCDWLNGAFLIFPKNILDKLAFQKLDERFFMYGEDYLWCWQFKELDYSSYFYSGTKIVHINNGSTDEKKRLLLRKLMIKNELEIMRERKGNGLYFKAFKIIYLAKENVRMLILNLLN